jgi:hypothetical protein
MFCSGKNIALERELMLVTTKEAEGEKGDGGRRQEAE